MADETTTPRATKVRVLKDAHVRAEFTLHRIDRLTWDRAINDGKGGFRESTVEEQARMLEGKAREFEAFIRDHRSQDPVALYVEREYADVCSACGQAWDVYAEAGTMYCGYCGADVEAA